ncbi:MAG: hypothetical protein U0T32_07425 [Chitinophagales bacterium]
MNGNLNNVEFYFNPTNDAWCRDHGPAFVVNYAERKKLLSGGDITLGGEISSVRLERCSPYRIAKEFGLGVSSVL